MSDPYIGEIRLFGGTFNPVGWAFCDGSLLAISQYDALFALIGTTYGGDGVNTFGLPDLRGRVPVHMNGSTYVPGQLAGAESVTLTTNQLPVHNHALLATTTAAASNVPTDALMATAGNAIYFPFAPTAAMAPQSIAASGGSQPHENMMPFLAVSFIIALEGIFPTQS